MKQTIENLRNLVAGYENEDLQTGDIDEMVRLVTQLADAYEDLQEEYIERIANINLELYDLREKIDDIRYDRMGEDA